MVLSVAAHAVVLTALALHTPRLLQPYEDAGPPEPVIPVLIMPRTPPAAPGVTRQPQPIRLHRRRLRPELPPPPVAPFTPPIVAPAPPPAPTRPAGASRFSVQPSPATELSTTLRGGLIGCANPSLLSRSEREKCLERLGRGAADAPHIPPPGDAEFERAAAAREATRRERESPSSAAIPDPDAGAGASNRNKPLYIPTLPPLRP